MSDQSDGDRPRTESVLLEPWFGPWEPDDPNANYKAEIALYSRLDPMTTLKTLADEVGVPSGAVARHVLALYAATGSRALLELGPSMVVRLWEPIASAEAKGSDDARLQAYEQLRQLVSWLRLPLEDEAGY